MASFRPFFTGGSAGGRGVLNNLPVDVMQERVAGARIVAFELSRTIGRRVEKRFGPTVLRLSSRRKADGPASGNPAAADVLFRPPVDGYGLLDFPRIRPLIDSAYRWTRDELARSNLKERLLGP